VALGDCVAVKEMRFVLRIIKQEKGQAMVEYVVVTMAVIAGVLTINTFILPPLNDLYTLMADMISLPFP
jgi:Flp pilus assembly pilin Flp